MKIWHNSGLHEINEESICSGHIKMPMHPHCASQIQTKVWTYVGLNLLINQFIINQFSEVFVLIYFPMSLIKNCETQITEWLTSDHLMRVHLKPWIWEIAWDQRHIFGGIYWNVWTLEYLLMTITGSSMLSSYTIQSSATITRSNYNANASLTWLMLMVPKPRPHAIMTIPE